MPSGVGRPERIVEGVAEAVPALGVEGVGDDRIRLNKAPKRRVVVACPVAIEN